MWKRNLEAYQRLIHAQDQKENNLFFPVPVTQNQEKTNKIEEGILFLTSAGLGGSPKKKDKKGQSNPMRRESTKHEEVHRTFITEFLRTIFVQHPSSKRVWEKAYVRVISA